MNRTRLIFAAIIAVAVLIVGISLALRGTAANPTNTALTIDRPDQVTIRILTALPVSDWVVAAANDFNMGANTVDGVPIQVEIESVDGLTALGRWERNDFGALDASIRPDDLTEAERAALADFPTAWIPDSRYLVELANASYK